MATRLLIVLTILALSSPALAANAFVQSVGTKWFGGSGVTESVNLTVTAGSTLAIFTGWQAGTGASITSVAGNGNTYTLGDALTDTTVGAASTYYVKNAASGSTTVLVTWGADPGYGVLVVHEISGADTTTPLDQHTIVKVANPGAGSANAITTGNVTTTTAGQYIFGAVFDEGGGVGALTQGTGYTKRQAQEALGASEDQIQGAGGAIAATFTTDTGFETYLVGILTFKAAGGGGGPTCNGGLLLLGVGGC